ncbi:MAG: amidohydrolase [Spirochaetia bacterium]|jgi:5-methylthioadenosine/S-adenosylhomocysteine deaminase|nr:amidohydrolase [Spirochaetia bacterium]
MADLLIENITIVTMNEKREILEKYAFVVDGSLIKDIGPSELIKAKYKDTKKIIDGTGKIIFPGLINTHNHLFQTLLKGLGDDLNLADWLAQMTFPSSAHLLPENVYDASMLGCVEGIRCGTTTQLDYMYPHAREGLSDGVVNAFKDLKIRGILGRGMMNIGEQFGVPKAIMQDLDTIEKDCYRLFDTYHKTENDRIKVWTAPAALWSNSEELLKLAWRITNEYDSGFTIHVSETPFDREAGKEIHGVFDFDVLEKLGIVGPNVLMVHCVHLTPEDIKKAKQFDLKVSHNTTSNMYLASGVAPVPEMLKAGLTVGLGVDGAASNNSQDMIELLKHTALLHKVYTQNPTVITAEKVLEMATIDGARAIGEEKNIGSIEVGKKADFFIYNPALSAKSTPMHHPVSTLVYSGTHACVETVVIDGNIILENSILKTADEYQIIKRGQEAADDLSKRAGTSGNKRRKWRSV